MSTKYKATIPAKAYFITITTVNWVDLFTRLTQRMLIADSLNYCATMKGLEIYGYCIMPSHLHLLCRAPDEVQLYCIIRDFKKYTSKKIIETILDDRESRRDWMIEMFRRSCGHLKRKQQYKVWQNGYHAVMIESEKFVYQKLEYIHNNPVAEKIVEFPWEYVFSSARDYADKQGLVKVHCLGSRLITY